MYQILIVDSDERHMKIIKKILEVAPKEYTFYYASTPETALAVLEKNQIHVFICELELPVMSGEEMFYLCSRISPETILIALSPAEDIRSTLSSINRSGTFKLILKPCRIAGDILIPVKEAIRIKEMRKHQEDDRGEKERNLELVQREEKKVSRAVEERKAEYTAIMNMVSGFVKHNLWMGKVVPAGTITDELQEHIRQMYEAFVQYYIFEPRDWNGNEKRFLEEFHNPGEGQFLKIENQVEGDIPTEFLPSICYAIYLLLELVRSHLLAYRVSVFLAGKKNRIVLVFRCDLSGSRDENGKILYRITNRENFEKTYRGTLHTLYRVSSQVTIDREKNPYAVNLAFEQR